MKLTRNVRWLMIIMLGSWLSWKPFPGYADVLAKVGGITFMKPIHKAPANDPFTFIDTDNLSGQIAYAPQMRDGQGEYVVIRTLKNGKQVGVQTLPIGTGFDVFGVSFSPDGQSILFKIGPTTSPTDMFKIYIWNIKTQKVILGPTSLAFYRVRWSPSGKYIAYCRGGDRNGDEYPAPGAYVPLKLYTFDLSTDKENFIAKAPSLVYFTWTEDNHLLYSMTSQNYAEQLGTYKKSATQLSPLLNIYESSPTGSEPQLIVKDGFAPKASPDGTKFVFLAHEDIDDRNGLKSLKVSSNDLITYPILTVYDSKSNNFQKIKFKDTSSIFNFRWMSKPLTILVASNVPISGGAAMRIDSVDLKTMKQQQVTKIQVQDTIHLASSISAQQFDNLKLSRDMKRLFLQARYVGDHNSELDNTALSPYKYYVSLKAANLTDGSNITICVASSTFNIDWNNVD